MFNQLVSSTYFLPILVYVCYVTVTSAGLYWYFRIFKKKIIVSMSETSVMHIPTKLLEAIRIKDDEWFSKLPENMESYIRKPTSSMLVQRMLEIYHAKHNDVLLDIKRMTTVMAAIYGVSIPPELVHLDSRAKVFYMHIKKQLELTYVSYHTEYSSVAAQYIKEYEDYDMKDRFEDAFRHIGNHLTTYAADASYPGLNIFCGSVRIPNNRYGYLTDVDIRSLATAFAGIAKIKIPTAYINVDIMAVVMMVPKHLLVKQKDQPILKIVQNG